MSKPTLPLTRRAFLIKSTATAVGSAMTLKSAAAQPVQAGTSPNDTIRVGFIGVGNRGSQLLQGFMAQKDCRVAALCDVYEPVGWRRSGAPNGRSL